jgi:hypothetical protein
MGSENLMQSSLAPVRGTRSHCLLSEITHDLKNCMSILFYWVETVEMDQGLPNEDSMGDLKKLIDQMTCLIERLDSL